MPAKLHNIAVLIDADNASANNIGYILQKIETFGRITCKNIYGDWGNAHIKSWQDAMLRYAINPMQQFAYAKGKNATDIGMVIEAMDLLYSDVYDGFCLISSDSDFTSLALRIRKNGVKVFGFGKHSTVIAFTQACDEFYYVETLSAITLQTKSKAEEKLVKSNNPNTSKNLTSNTTMRWTTESLQTQTHFITILNKVIQNNPNSNKGWSHLSYIAGQLKQHHQNVKLDKYGYAKFSDLIRAIALYDVHTVNKVLSIKLKDDRLPISTAESSSNTISVWDENRLKCDTKLINSLRASIIDHPKAEDGHWVNFALVGSGIKKNYSSFDPKYYGYSKLADIINKIDLFETKFINSTLYVRDKNYSKISVQSNASTIDKDMDNTKSYPVFMNSNIEVSLRSPGSAHVDYIAFRLTNENVVRGDQDMVFYGQNESPDASLILKDLELAPSSRATYFSCKLAEQDKQITQIVFVATAQDSNLKSAHPIKVSIRNSKKIIYEGEFGTNLKSAQTRKLFVLVKKSNEWHMHPQNSVIKGDLRFLCEKYGVELSDD